MSKPWLPERLPEDIDVERSFLATCCAPGAGPVAVDAVAMLQVDDFVHPAHKAVFLALLCLVARDEEVNSLTLKTELEVAGSLNRVGGYPGLVELLAGEDVERPQALGRVIREKSRLRKLVHLGAQLVRQAAGEEDTSTTLAMVAVDGLVALGQDSRTTGFRQIGEFDQPVLERLDEVRAGNAVPGVPTGFSKLDWMLGGGFKPGQLIVLAARPGIGKSTLAQGFAAHAARMDPRRGGGRVGFWSLEMGSEEVWTRMAASRAGISSGDLSTGNITAAQRESLNGYAAELKRLPFFINDQATTNVPIMRGHLDRLVSRGGPVVLGVVDYLQLVKSVPGSAASKQNESTRVGDISRDLKLMAKDRGLPIILLSQMNREVEHRNGGRPQLSDLRDSGAIEQDADVVMFIHRANVTPMDSMDGSAPDLSAELIVAKQRNGPTGIVRLVQDLKQFRFVEMARETDSSSSPSPSQDPWAGYKD